MLPAPHSLATAWNQAPTQAAHLESSCSHLLQFPLQCWNTPLVVYAAGPHAGAVSPIPHPNPQLASEVPESFIYESA